VKQLNPSLQSLYCFCILLSGANIMLEERISLRWLHLLWHFSAIDSVTTLHTCVYRHHHTHSLTHTADMWFISWVYIKWTITAPVRLQCWTQGAEINNVSKKEEIYKQNNIGFRSSWMWSCVNGLTFPDISKECSTFINKRTKRDAPLWKHHSHTGTHCVNIFLQSITSNKECYKNKHHC